MLGTIVGLIIIGLVAGAIARLVMPGKQNIGILGTILVGVVGSFVGGFLGKLIFNSGNDFVQPSSWIGSIIGAIIVLFLYLKLGGRARARS
ncbi:GlsB/YeaQ/YmgE family stress response membrane protein [Kineococcus gynurae]|uniref:GlsB/YeaQ/YmgE family stress response membrane protein n=1 Tax=Kineococcus gynurae TaxID=452979 RepID=A0ABV5LT48_9ACTN